MNIIDDRKQQINQNMDERRKYDDVFISKIRSNFKLYTFDVGLTLFFFCWLDGTPPLKRMHSYIIIAIGYY